MKEQHRQTIVKIISIITIAFLVVMGGILVLGAKYMNHQLLLANEGAAVDIAELIKANFVITDEEVAYMKELSFNDMETDAINRRLMSIADDAHLNAQLTNVYLIAPLSSDEVKYVTDEKTSEFFGYEEGTPLDGIWLLNGAFENGTFHPTQRDDIYRYTHLTREQRKGMEAKESYGEFSQDAWGEFITGYVPIYTSEGSFVGLLGIDISPDKFQQDAKRLVIALFLFLAMTSVVMMVLFLYFYSKYMKTREGQLYFEFYSRMSHDMRTPMNGILGMTALSKNETDINVLKHNISKIEDAGHYMLGLINDTLDVQKLDAGRLKLDLKTRNCSEVVEQLVAMARPDAEKKHIQFQVINRGFSENIYSYVDELRIQQIFMNIVSNAIKFTPEGGQVTFTLECIGEDEHYRHGRFQITDTGIGMSQKFIRENLFHPFEQEQNSRTTQYGGSGLGLSIVKSLVELMGGRIEVESSVGLGTTFTIYLDFQKAEPEAVEQYCQEQENNSHLKAVSVLKGRRLLLCEDNTLNAEIAVKLLEKQECIVTVAHNGREGLELYTNSPGGTFDLILMDIRMPVMDGLEATGKIRASQVEDARTIPIIAMTANAYEEDIQQCMDAGMNGHISKPIDPQGMYEMIAKHLI